MQKINVTMLSDDFPDILISKWQEIADLLAGILSIPAALIMKIDSGFMEVLISSNSENNPYHVHDREKWDGLYCQTVIQTRKKLLIKNATKDNKWKNNPDIKLGMISYLGFPINFPDNQPFGTLCALDTKENEFSIHAEKLLLQFISIIENDLRLLLVYKQQSTELGKIANVKKLNLAEKNTELQKAIEIAEQHDRYNQMLFDASPIGLALTRFSGELIYVNKAFSDIIGYTNEETLTLSYWDITPEKYSEQEQIQIAALNSTGFYGPYEKEYKHKSGNLIPVRLIGKAITYGSEQYIWSSVEDITEKKKIEREIIAAKEKAEENEHNFRSLFQSMQEGFYLHQIICNNQGTAVNYRIIEANPVSEKYLNIKSENAIGKLATDLYGTSEAPFLDVYAKVVQTGQPVSFEQYFEPMEKYFNISVFSPGKGIFATVFTDITDVKNHEKDLIQSKARAEESDRLKSAFLANMSHEIRTPMNGILGFSELLKEPKLSAEELLEYIRIIEKSGIRMLNTINDIIDISKIESGLMTLKIEDSDITKQFDFVYTFFKPEIEAKGMQIYYNNTLPLTESIIKTDREKLYSILTNLIKNAIKYSDKGSIEIGCVKKGKFLEFYVKDTGIGITKDRQDSVFERFIQADISDTRAFQGAGLGLAITKSYVEMLGGNIWVESTEGLGSVFYFTLPFNNENFVQENLEKSVSVQYPENQIKPLKVLIAEDDFDSSKYIQIIIKEFARETILVKNGSDAIEASRANPDIDLILMDIKMPMVDGYEAVRQIRSFNRDVLIIAQTAYALLGDGDKALEAGCNDYLSKPIKKTDLLNLLKKYFWYAPK
jgi:PAS domain S-box-containing protein